MTWLGGRQKLSGMQLEGLATTTNMTGALCQMRQRSSAKHGLLTSVGAGAVLLLCQACHAPWHAAQAASAQFPFFKFGLVHV